MKWILRDMKAAMLASMLLCLMAAPTFPQSAGSENPAAPPRPGGSSPSAIHYHYHFHNYGNMPTQALTYPNYATPYTAAAWNPYNPMPPSTAAPTQAQPYPPGYILGPYAPLGFQNAAPGRAGPGGESCLPAGQRRRGVSERPEDARQRKGPQVHHTVLQSNKEYQYWVTATFKQNGQSVTKYRKVVLGAGEYNVADFTRPPEENPIRLPAGPVDPNTVRRQ